MKKLVSLAWSLLLIFSLERLDVFQEHLGGVLELPPEAMVGQTFVAKHDNLSMISLLSCDNPELANKDDLVFHLKEYSEGKLEEEKDLATIVFNGTNIGEHDVLQLKFSPLSHSANKKFYFYIENAEEVSEEGLNEEVLKIGYTKQDFYQEGSLVYKNREAEGDLAFRTFYSLYPHQFIAESLKDFLVRFQQDKFFLLFYLSVISLLAWLIRKS